MERRSPERSRRSPTEVPGGQNDYRPHAEVRTFANDACHLAFWNRLLEEGRPCEKPAELNELPRRVQPKAAGYQRLRESFSMVA